MEGLVAEAKTGSAREVPARDVTVEGAEKVKIRWLIAERDGAERIQMRLFEVGPSGRTPLHRHDWEHEVFILRGEGKLLYEGTERPFAEGHFVFVPAGAEHAFVNTGRGNLEFLCMIPTGTDKG
jgi:quercetin dioxygenase-like cupin family protein